MNEQRRNILITGGTGSLGTALVAKWYNHHNITILSKDPHKQQKLDRRFPGLEYVLADICDPSEVRRACRDQDILIHAAAVKQVDMGEYHPSEFTRVNVNGTKNIADIWAHECRGKRALLISTDKAVSPINAYGKSKGIAEAIFRKYDFSVLRYGNVVKSEGSFLHEWKRRIENNEPVEIRKPYPTRFYVSFDLAINLIEGVLDIFRDGIFVPRNLKAFEVKSIAEALSAKTVECDLLPYEKQHEILVADGEVAIKKTEIIAQILPGWSETIGIEIDPMAMYKSNTVERMTGQEFLETIGWQ